MEDNREKSFASRKMYKIKCSNCGKDAEVPFEPTEGRDVFCKECFQNKKY